MRVGICGAGIGGLAIASLLHDVGHDIEIFDQFEAPKPVGSGLILQPVGQSVLDKLGLLPQAIEGGDEIHQMVGNQVGTHRKVLDVSYRTLHRSAFGLGIHRGTLFELLLKATQDRGIILHSNFRVVAISADRIVSDAGRETSPFDLVIDALGARSPLSPIVTRPLAYGAIWGTVDWHDGLGLDPNQLSQRYDKAHTMLGILPCGQGKASIFWSIKVADYPDLVSGGLQAWQDRVQRLWPEYGALAKQLTALEEMSLATYAHGTLNTPVCGHIVQIGDSAHQASPQLGQGANMALLDACALRDSLSNPVALDQALKAYVKSRRRHIQFYQYLSYFITPMYQSDSTLLPWIRDNFVYPVSQIHPINQVMTRLARGDIISAIRS